MADITSSRWISDATRYMMETRKPTLTLTYLPHLDYNLQRLGPDLKHPDIQTDLQAVDELCGELIAKADEQNQNVIVVSEYGITPVTDAVHINRELRSQGLLKVRDEQGSEQLDAGASDAFAVVDHQVAHVYVNDKSKLPAVRQLLESMDGIEHVLGDKEKPLWGLDHERSGELVAISNDDRWFSYYYWLDQQRAPDYSRTVDIHRKPGYDPVELFVDPSIGSPKLAVGFRLLKKKLGFRTLLNVISNHETTLVKGSHGRVTDSSDHGPLVISSDAALLPNGEIEATAFKQLVLDHVFVEENINEAIEKAV